MESKRKVQTEEAQQYAKDSDIIHMETSAKTATNVRDLFIEIGEYAPPHPVCREHYCLQYDVAEYMLIWYV